MVRIIDDALPAAIAEHARDAWLAASFALVEQTRERHYEHVFKTESPALPKTGEAYTARFGRSPALEEGFARAFFEQHLRPRLAIEESRRVQVRAHEMRSGDHQRIHLDDYFAELGFIYYLSKGWRWDWGGLLMVARGDEATAVLPKFNRLVVLEHAQKRAPHCVTQVAPCAQEPRYSLAGFVS